MMAAKAVPDPDTPDNDTALPARVAADIAAELQMALSFVFRDADTVEFTVADRTGDQVPENIRYDWSGTIGDSLTREYNGSPPANVIEAVEEFSLLYDTTGVNEPKPQQSAEVFLAGKMSAADTPDPPLNISSTEWAGQYFEPSLPAGATSWTVTRLQFYTRNPPAAGDAIWVQLRPPDMSGLPTPTVLEQYYAVIGDPWIWHEENFNDIPPWPADQGLCLVVSWAGGESPAKLRYTTEDVDRLLTTDGGATWVRSTADSLLYAVYGTYTEDVMTPITYLTGIRIKLRTGPDPTTRVETSVPLLHVHDITP